MSETRRQMIRDQLLSLTDEIQGILDKSKESSMYYMGRNCKTDLTVLRCKLESAKNVLNKLGNSDCNWTLLSVEEFYSNYKKAYDSKGRESEQTVYDSSKEMIQGLTKLEGELRQHCLENLEAIENSFKPKPTQQEEYHAGLWASQKRERM